MNSKKALGCRAAASFGFVSIIKEKTTENRVKRISSTFHTGEGNGGAGRSELSCHLLLLSGDAEGAVYAWLPSC